ncbi:MAG: hypothetical protein LBR74_02185, partial [Eubacterium sp.]|nr:hypothetical protein [Eubacterium sp.]
TELSGNEEETIGEAFALSGGQIKVTYEIESAADTGVALIYILKEGATKSQNEDGELDIAIQDVSAMTLSAGTETGEEILENEKPAGNYYLDVNTTDLTSYKVYVYEKNK